MVIAVAGRICMGALITVALVSCAGDDSEKKNTPSESGAGTRLTIWVLADEGALADIPVVFDAPGKERVSKVTEADGHVTFEGAPGSVTVLSPNHTYETWLEASPESSRRRPNASDRPADDLVVFLTPLKERSVELRGTIAGKADTHDAVTLAASGSRTGYRALEDTYALRVPIERSFFLLGHVTKPLEDQNGVTLSNEHVSSFRLDVPGRTDDQTLDLDLTKLPALPTRKIKTRIPKLEGFTTVTSSIVSADSALSIGLFGKSAGEEVELTVVETSFEPERVLSRASQSKPDGSRSTRIEEGIVADGTTWTDFALPPTIPDPDASRSLRDPIPLDGFPAGADLVAEIYAAGQLAWIVHGPPGGPREKSFAVPYRGEITSIDVQVVALSLSARTGWVSLGPHQEFHRSIATHRDILLRKR